MAGIRFPATSFRDIKLFITFVAKNYSNRRESRTAGGGNYYSGRDTIAEYTLPVPMNMTSSTNIDFDRGKTNETPFIESLLGMFTSQGGGGRSLLSFATQLPLVGGIISPSFIRDLTIGGQAGLVDQDRSEMLFNQANFRTFQFNFSMVARNEVDAAVASQIANGFETNAYPIPDKVNQSMRHPPLWQWYVTASEGGKIASGKLWAGQPQTSVLTSVTVNRTGGGGVYAVKDSGVGFTDEPQPLVTNLSLTYTELEPNLQDDNGNIISRSAALTRDSF